MFKLTFQRIQLLGSAICLALLSVLTITSPVHAATVCDDMPATIVGTAGNDTLTGTPNADVIVGLAGNDIISGLGGDDRICAGIGHDIVYGDVEVRAPGVALGDNDRIFGEDGIDQLIGDFRTATSPGGGSAGGGNDYIDGGGAGDIISGGFMEVTVTTTSAGAVSSADTLIGGDGNDTIYGQGRTLTYDILGPVNVSNGNTTIIGGAGSDSIYGDLHTLTFNGIGVLGLVNAWNDTIVGADDNDRITGDVLNGGGLVVPVASGNDTINGGAGTDIGDANFGTDTCTATEAVLNCEL